MRAPQQAATTLDRSPQHLPIPLGGLSASHAVRPRRTVLSHLRAWRRTSTMAGLVSGALGAVLLASATPPAVFVDARGAHVAGAVLAPAPSGDPAVSLYRGDAALVVRWLAGGATAAAVTTLDGEQVTGSCRMRSGGQGASERCSFDVNGRMLTAADTYVAAAGRWRRRYSDGTTAEFTVPRGTRPIPVPFPLGEA